MWVPKKELFPVSKQQILFIVEDTSSAEWYQVGVLGSVSQCRQRCDLMAVLE